MTKDKNLYERRRNRYDVDKAAVAKRYFPHLGTRQALRQFNRWIERCPPLMRDLELTGWKKRVHTLTHRQISLIYYHLGEPDTDES